MFWVSGFVSDVKFGIVSASLTAGVLWSRVPCGLHIRFEGVYMALCGFSHGLVRRWRSSGFRFGGFGVRIMQIIFYFPEPQGPIRLVPADTLYKQAETELLK